MNEQLKIIISAEIDKLKQNVDKAKSEVKSFKDQVKKASENVDKDIAAMGTSIQNAGKVMATSLAAAGAALLALGASTQEYRNEQAKLVTAFEAAGGSAEEAKETYNDLYRVLGDGGQAVEAASHLAQLTTNEKDLAEWTNVCQGVYATFGSSLPIESLTEAANETAKVGTLTGSLADALNWAGVSEEKFQEQLDACNTEAEREALIRETLSGLYDDAAKKYEENNAQVLAQNEAQAKLQETTAKLGEAVAPVITAFTSFANDCLAALNPYIQELSENYAPALNEALSVMGKLVGDTLGFLVDNWEIVAGVAGVIAGISAAIGLYNTVAAVKAAMDAAQVTTVWALVSAHLAQTAAAMAALAPYLLIVAAIAAVIAIIVLCIKHWDDIVAAVKKAFGFMVELVSKGVQAIGNFFGNMWSGLKEGAKNAWQGVRNVFSSVATFFKDIFSKAWQGVKNVFSAGGKIFSGIKEGIEKTFKSVVNTIIDGINKVVAVPFNAINNILGKIKGISIAGIKPFNWMWTLNVPQIHKLATGGVVDSATLAMIGERGKEAVVPLENNLGWLDKLASMLNERMGGNTPIVLQVDGKTFATTAISTINNHTKQTGRLALNII
jgi:phage-related protein